MDNTVTPVQVPDALASRLDQMFPTLTPAQIERVALHGRLRSIREGEVLIETGDQIVPFFVVKSGQVEVVRLSGATGDLITTHGPGSFTGEANMLSGRRSLVGEGTTVQARTVIIATGAEYRKLPNENLSQFEGVGVYYAATFMESQLCGKDDVIVVGGGNSAGQAAVFLARTAQHVHLLIRADRLTESMSAYLIRRIEEAPNITLHTQTEIASLEGGSHLERVCWRYNDDGTITTHEIRHIFVMTGASPTTQWLGRCVALDAKGFIKTGPDLSPDELAAACWPLTRSPHLLETSLPGVFAVGDIRSGNIKRVASAVGEGSVVVSFVHQALNESEGQVTS
jgi:thioredoxin reductase